MAPSTETPYPWGEWQDAQQRYWESWQETYGQMFDQKSPGSSPSNTSNNPWLQMSKQWEELLNSHVSVDNNQTAEGMASLGKSYLSVGQAFWEALEQARDTASKGQSWQNVLSDAFLQMHQAWPAANPSPYENLSMGQAASVWQLPLDAWKRVAHYFSVAPGDMHKGMHEFAGLGVGSNSFVDWWLSVPQVGYSRERQAQIQHWGGLSTQYLKSVQDYVLVLGDVTKRAINILGEKLAKAAKQKQAIDSLRVVYDLWIDSGEEAYAEFVSKPEFSNLQAQQVNALMRLKQHEQLMIEQAMGALNMPTRRELDTTHRRVHELRRELRKLESKLDALTEAKEEIKPIHSKVKSKVKSKAAVTHPEGGISDV